MPPLPPLGKSTITLKGGSVAIHEILLESGHFWYRFDGQSLLRVTHDESIVLINSIWGEPNLKIPADSSLHDTAIMNHI